MTKPTKEDYEEFLKNRNLDNEFKLWRRKKSVKRRIDRSVRTYFRYEIALKPIKREFNTSKDLEYFFGVAVVVGEHNERYMYGKCKPLTLFSAERQALTFLKSGGWEVFKATGKYKVYQFVEGKIKNVVETLYMEVEQNAGSRRKHIIGAKMTRYGKKLYNQQKLKK